MQALNYNPVAYDTLPGIMDAKETYDTRGLADVVSGPVRDLFLQYPSIAKNFGIQLLHQHFPMKRNERLVERCRVSAPWKVDNASEDDDDIAHDSAAIIERYGGRIVPRIFRLLDGVFAPVEFTWEAAEEKDIHAVNPEELVAFLPALAKLLVSLGVDGALGLRQRDKDDAACPVEVQQGRANIMFPWGGIPAENLIEVFWSFTPDEEGGLVEGSCPTYCYHGPSGRTKVHENACE